MKRSLFLFVVLLGLISCKKEFIETSDYREKITGKYIGIRIDTYWVDTIVGYGRDTSNVTITVTPAEQDSIVDITFTPPYSNENFSFKYVNNKLISTSDYHPPALKINNDSLYFRHQPGLGPYWIECFCKK